MYGKIAVDDGKGKVNFQESVTVTGDIGKVGGAIKELIASGSSGKKVTLKGDVYTKKLEIVGSGEVELKKNLTAGGDGVVFSNTDSKLKIAGNNTTVTGTINGGSDYYGILEFTGEGNKVEGAVGKHTKLLKEVKFTGNGTITGNVYAKNINVEAGKKATLGSIVHAENGLRLRGATSIVSFLNNTTVDSQINGNGIVEFQSDATLNKNIGAQGSLVSEVKFSAGSNVELNSNSNICSGKINLQGKIDVKQNVQMFGQIGANKATISLGQNTLDINNNIEFKGENTINATIKDNKIGNIKADSVTHGDDSKLKINIECEDRPTGGQSRKYVFLDIESSTVDKNKIEVSAAEGSCSKLTLDSSDTKGITLIQKDTALQDISRALVRYDISDAESISNAQALAFALEDTDAYDVVKSIGKAIASGDEKKFKKLMQGLENTNSAVDIITQVSIFQNSSIDRLDFLLPAPTSTAAAGDEDYKYGAWLDPFYGTAKQKAKGNFSGYKDESFGASFGVDSRLSSDLVLGVAFGMSNNKLSYKDIKDGDKTGINSSAFSVYGIKQINERWSLSSVATLALSSVKRDTKKVSATGDYENVEGKYKTLSFSSQVIAAYKQYIGNVTISPMGGLRYVGLNSTRYQETGSTACQNLNVCIEAVGQLESIIGLKLSTSNIVLKGWQVMPNFNVSASYDIFGQPHRQKVMLGGIGEVATPVYKPARTLYNVGIGVNAEYESWELGLSYNTKISNKYLGHQGNFKLSFNF